MLNNTDYKVIISEGINNFNDAVFIRTEVFVKEQGFKDEFDEIDETAVHIVIYDNDKPVATARAYTENGAEYHAGRVAVMKEYRKNGIGRILMDCVENEIKKRGGKEIVISAQLRAFDFYKKLGYKPYGQEYLDEYCPHISMKKILV